MVVYSRLLLSALIICSACGARNEGEETLGPHNLRFPPESLVSHALGGIKGKTYSNSSEALEGSLKRGSRFLEVDLSFTADGDLVCFHSKHEKHLGVTTPVTEMTTAEFLKLRYADRFTLMDFKTLLRRLEEHPNVFLVTDCKDDFNRCMESVIAVAESVDPMMVGRIIPQFYTVDQWRDVAQLESEHGPFATVIFTLYKTRIDDDAVVELARTRAVPVITMSRKRFNPDLVARLNAIGVDTLVHTVNKVPDMLDYVDHGVRGLYTDRFATWSEVVDAADASSSPRSGPSAGAVADPPRG